MRAYLPVILVAAAVSACANNTPGKSVHITQSTWDGYREYLGIIGTTKPGVFAVSTAGDGAYGYSYCEELRCNMHATTSYKTLAMKTCREYASNCEVFAIGQDIQVQYQIVN